VPMNLGDTCMVNCMTPSPQTKLGL